MKSRNVDLKKFIAFNSMILTERAIKNIMAGFEQESKVELLHQLNLYHKVETDQDINDMFDELKNNPNVSKNGRDGFYDLVVLLTRKGFSVECKEPYEIPSERKFTDKEGYMICLDEGITMRKCLQNTTPLILNKPEFR